MCGIAGFAGFEDKTLLKRMCDVIEHRGPNDDGYFSDRGASLGIRRLSIIDVAGGHQPVRNETNDMFIVFNGEIYNYRELRSELEGRHKFYTGTDTETVLHLYETYGRSCVEKLRGMFAFAIWDYRKKRLFIARDRLGKKPLYYTWVGKKFLFASEIKSLLECDEVKRSINRQALHDFLTLQYVPGPNTMFEGIFKLPPGCSAVIEDGSMEISRYWGLPNPTAVGFNENNSAKELERLLDESVKIRLMSEVPLGVFLSGGLDSSVITALMSKYVAPVRTFSVGFNRPDDELKYARIVAEKFGTDHHELIVDAKSADVLEKVVWHFDEPVADPAAVPTFLMSQLARKDMTVVLVGEGGDETFTGYPKYSMMLDLEKYGKFLPDFAATHIVPAAAAAAQRFLSGRGKKQAEFLGKMAPDLSDRSLVFLGMSAMGFDEKEKSELYSAVKPFLPTRRLLDEKLPLFDRMITFDRKYWLPDRLLMKVDKMTMAHSMEARAPLLDHKLVEFMNNVPVPYRLGKRLLKLVALRHLPREIVLRKKHGFSVPLSDWFGGDMKGYSAQLLEDLCKREMFNRDGIQALVKDPLALKNDQKIWNLVNLELWMRKFIDMG